MKSIRVKGSLSLALMVALGACSTVETTRNVAVETTVQSARTSSWIVSDVRVDVPSSLTVSEAHMYIPPSDIVWREDPLGDRHLQVQEILDNAISLGVQSMDGFQPVYVDVTLHRFHALSEKARYSVGGRHTIEFSIVVRDTATGLALSEPAVIKANLHAFGGQKALDAMRRGETQKVRITRHLAGVVQAFFAR